MVLENLRQRTAAAHQEVESRVDLLSPALTIARYRLVLRAFEAFFVPCEAALDARCPVRFRGLWAGRRRAHRLRDDLAAVGAAPDNALGSGPEFSWLEDDGEWLGALYVVEGSRLGGQVIARHVEGHFGLRNGCGYSFFLGHSAETREEWRSVCVAVEYASMLNNQIIEGALLTFHQMNRCIELFL